MCEKAAGYICPFAFVKHVDMPTHMVSPFYPPPFPSPQLPPRPLAPHSPPQFVPKFVTNWKNNLKTRVCAYPMPLGMPDVIHMCRAQSLGFYTTGSLFIYLFYFINFVVFDAPWIKEP